MFESLAYGRNTTPNLTKLQDRSVPMIFVGYEAGSKAYRLYDPKAKRLHISRDVKFLEEEEYKWDVQQLEENKKEGGKFAVHYDPQVYVKDEDILEERGESSGTLLGDDSSPANDLSIGDDSYVSSSPRKFRSLREIYSDSIELNEEAGMCFLSLEEPNSYMEARDNEKWQQAMLEDLSVIEKNGT